MLGQRTQLANEKIRALVDSDIGYSTETWTGLTEMGVIGALFNESDGGYGGAGFDVALVFEELGRVSAVDPLLNMAVLCGGVFTDLGNDGQKALIEPIIESSLQMEMAHAEPQSRYELTRVETRATRDGS